MLKLVVRHLRWLVILTPMFAGAQPSQATAYNAVTDFSLSSNSNGVWSYLSSGSLLSSPVIGSGSSAGWNYWWDGKALPNSATIGANVSGNTLTVSNSVVIPTNVLEMDPEANSNVAVRFTAPAAGTYSIIGNFLGIDTNQKLHSVEIIHNGVAIFTNTISAFNQNDAFNLTETLSAGDFVDFVTDTGSTTYEDLSTGLSVTITTALPTGTAVTTAPLIFDFYYYLGNQVALTQTVPFPGIPTVGYSIGSLPGWLSITPSSSNTPVANLTVVVNASELAPGAYTSQISILEPSGAVPQTVIIPVALSVSTKAPNIASVVNAAGGTGPVAPNTWVTLYGTDLSPYERSWQSSDFTNGQMPTQLSGVSVDFGGQSAYVSYISPTQVNVLTPPNVYQGSVAPGLTIAYPQTYGSLTLSSCAAICSPSVQSGPVSPAFFVFNAGPYVAAEHANGSLVGPANLIPGQTSPAKPGETVVLFANGFGATSQPVISGALTQSGILPSMPVVIIGGVSAVVQFAGLISPGLYQFNVVVPSSAPNGDSGLSATYNGLSTQNGLLISVQQ